MYPIPVVYHEYSISIIQAIYVELLVTGARLSCEDVIAFQQMESAQRVHEWTSVLSYLH